MYDAYVEYEWDEAKRRANADKHRIDFVAVREFEWETAIVRPTIRGSELRHIATGYIGARLHTVVFTERDGKRRIISLRRSSRQEERDYAQA